MNSPPTINRFRLDGFAALITGAGRGIGRATALAFADAGADVALAARRHDVLEEVAEEVRKRGRRAVVVPTDVNELPQLVRALSLALDAFGRLDVLVNNAGGWPPRTAMAVDAEDLEAAFRFNVTSAFELSRLAAPHLARSGRGAIVNISSAMSHVVDSGFVSYGTSKAALDHMTRLLANEWAPKIRVNAVAAGATLTDALSAFVDDQPLLEQMVAKIPLGRLGAPEDIAAAVQYLASPAAAWITGQILAVDGGAPGSVWPYRIPNALDE